MKNKQAERPSVNCKYCGLPTTIRCGSYKGVHRFYCKPCGRKFKADSSVYYMRFPSSLIGDTLNMFYSGVGLRDIRAGLVYEYKEPPSKEALYRWVSKYSSSAPAVFCEFHPSAGNTWLISKTLFYFYGRVYKIVDVVDIATRFLLTTSMTLTQDINIIRNVMNKAAENAGKYPEFILGHMPYSYFNRIKKAFVCEAEHMHNRLSAREYNVEVVAIIDAIFKPRLKIMYTMKNPDTVERFIRAWYVHYNYFQPQEMLGNRTPAYAAGISCSITGWQSMVEHLALNHSSRVM